MSQSVARKGDPVFSPADSHDTPNGPVAVPVTGNITAGSDTVFANDRPVARMGDKGTHAACLGENSFEIEEGSETVFADDKAVARAGDKTDHCGSTNPGGAKGSILNLTSINTFAG